MLFATFFCLLTAFCGFSKSIQVTSKDEIPESYHSYHEMSMILAQLANNFSDFASLYTIGKSAEQRDLWVLKIKAPNSPILGAPHIKYIGNIHGNEPVGRELILYLAEYLLKNYETDNEVKWILDRTVIHLLPSLNPDGFERSKEGVCYSGPGRENGNFVDLNRSFPDHFKDNRIPVQPETLAVTQWMSEIPFLLSASFHGGAIVANYPFDSNPEDDAQAFMEELKKNISRGDNLMEIWRNLTPNGSEGVNICTPGCFLLHLKCHPRKKDLLSPRYSLSPDDDVFRHLAQTYAESHLTMHKGNICKENQATFPGGITNGAAWYSLTGGMQDYNYVTGSCMELTLEISCCKYPLALHLPRLWSENKKAMLDLAKQSQMGVRGQIMDKITSAFISGATLQISGRNIPFTSSKNGEFWRMLLPGNYILLVKAKGYESQTFPFTISNTNVTYPTSTWLNIYLQPTEEMLESSLPNSARVFSSSLPPLICLSVFFAFFTSWT